MKKGWNGVAMPSRACATNQVEIFARPWNSVKMLNLADFLHNILQY